MFSDHPTLLNELSEMGQQIDSLRACVNRSLEYPKGMPLIKYEQEVLRCVRNIRRRSLRISAQNYVEHIFELTREMDSLREAGVSNDSIATVIEEKDRKLNAQILNFVGSMVISEIMARLAFKDVVSAQVSSLANRMDLAACGLIKTLTGEQYWKRRTPELARELISIRMQKGGPKLLPKEPIKRFGRFMANAIYRPKKTL